MAEETKETMEAPTPSEETSAAAEESKPKKEKKPKKPSELEQLHAEYDALSDRYLRLAAEYDNFRKRSARERDQIWPEVTAAVLMQFLDVADNFERALEAPCSDAEYQKGMEMTYRSLDDALTHLGAEAFGAQGDPFDPALHNAVLHVEDETLGTQVVAQVLKKGYRLGDKILRYAMVKVAN